MGEESKDNHNLKELGGPTSAEIAAILSEFNLLNNADDHQMQREPTRRKELAPDA